MRLEEVQCQNTLTVPGPIFQLTRLFALLFWQGVDLKFKMLIDGF